MNGACIRVYKINLKNTSEKAGETITFIEAFIYRKDSGIYARLWLFRIVTKQSILDINVTI
jgi:hypothetical protein